MSGITIGKYIVHDEWIRCGKSAYSRRIEFLNRDGHDEIYLLLPDNRKQYRLSFPLDIFQKEHLLMFGVDDCDFQFNSLEEAKEHADRFLKKLAKLRAFL